MSESLFSLEVHIESVDRVKVSCVLPAVSFRLLDYPTLIIHQIPPASAKKLREKSQIRGINKDHIETDLRDRHGNISFQKGKSCLFKANISNLQKQLEITPLYLMLIDLWPKKPKLIGSTVISLSNAIGKISSDVKKLGISVPSISQDEGTFDIFNLMGSVIGNVKMSFRLLSLGGSLMPHIPTTSIMPRKGEEKTQKKDVRACANDSLIELEEVDVQPNTNINEKPSELYRPIQQHIETQTDVPVPVAHRRPKNTRPTYNEDTEEPILPISNTVCPPPLFYNFKSHAENVGEKKIQSPKQKETYKVGVDDIDFIYYEPGLLQPDGSTGCASVCVQTDDVPTDCPAVPPEDIKDGRSNGTMERKINPDDIPLLNALLEELTYLRAKREDSSQDVGIDKPKKEIVKPEKVKQPSKPRECCLKVAAQRSAVYLRNMRQNQQVGIKKKVQFKQTSLTYGMTRTQRMRLEMNQNLKLQNPKLADSGMEEKKTLSLHPKSRQGKENEKSLVDPVSHEDLGKTHTVFTKLDSGEKSVTVSAGVQTENDLLEQATIPVPETSSDTKNKTSEQELGNTVIVENPQKKDILADVGNSSVRSLASQNSLDIYLPQVEGDSDGTPSLGNVSDQISSDDVPLPELPTTTAKYGNTGISSPDLPAPVIRRKSVTSPPGRSRTSTALSMYSDDFEESLIWESHDPSDDESDTSSRSHSSNYQSVDSHVKNGSQGTSASSDVKVDHSHPVKSNFSPEKSKNLKGRRNNSVDDGPDERYLQEDSKSYGERLELDTTDIHKEKLFDSLNSTNSDFMTRKENSFARNSMSEAKDVDNRSILQLPRPTIDLGYTY